jgi:hypothetical protein
MSLEGEVAALEVVEPLSPVARRVIAWYVGLVAMHLMLNVYMAHPEFAELALDGAGLVSFAVVVARLVHDRLGGKDDA